MNATVLLNARSSGTARHARAIPDLLASAGIHVDAFELAPDERVLRKRAKKALKRGVKLLIVGGGDGALATAVDVLAHGDTVLGVLPLGTGNSFAKTLGIPHDMRSAVDIIAAGREARVDLGLANGTHFANFATVGLSAEIAERAPHALKAFVGPAAYVAGAFPAFFTHRAFRAKIACDETQLALETHHIVVASGRYFGSRPVTPHASISDGRLALFTTGGVSRFALARAYVLFGLGLQQLLPDAHMLSAREITIKTSTKQLVNIDGNPLGTTPVRFGVAPRALRVLVPATFVAWEA